MATIQADLCGKPYAIKDPEKEGRKEKKNNDLSEFCLIVTDFQVITWKTWTAVEFFKIFRVFRIFRIFGWITLHVSVGVKKVRGRRKRGKAGEERRLNFKRIFTGSQMRIKVII